MGMSYVDLCVMVIVFMTLIIAIVVTLLVVTRKPSPKANASGKCDNGKQSGVGWHEITTNPIDPSKPSDASVNTILITTSPQVRELIYGSHDDGVEPEHKKPDYSCQAPQSDKSSDDDSKLNAVQSVTHSSSDSGYSSSYNSYSSSDSSCSSSDSSYSSSNDY